MNDLTFRCNFNSQTPKNIQDVIELELYIVYYCLIRFKTDGTFMYPYGG